MGIQEANKRKIRIRTATQKHVEMNQSNAVRKRHRYSYSNSLMPVPYQMNAVWSLFVCVSIQQTNHVITFNILWDIKTGNILGSILHLVDAAFIQKTQ